MKRITVVFLVVSLFFMVNGFALEKQTSDLQGNGVEKLVSDLLINRCNTWNMIYDEKNTMDDFKAELSKYVGGRLLKEDMAAFDEMKKSATEMERVEIVGFVVDESKKTKIGLEISGNQKAVIYNLDGSQETLLIREKLILTCVAEKWYMESLEVLE